MCICMGGIFFGSKRMNSNSMNHTVMNILLDMLVNHFMPGYRIQACKSVAYRCNSVFIVMILYDESTVR